MPKNETTYDLDQLLRDVHKLTKRCTQQEQQVADLTRMTTKQIKSLNELRGVVSRLVSYRDLLAPSLVSDLVGVLDKIDDLLLKTNEVHEFLIKQKNEK